jgi:hypothetical protein
MSSILVVHEIITDSIKQCKYTSHYKHGLIILCLKYTSMEKLRLAELTNWKILERAQLELHERDIALHFSQHAWFH